MGERTRSKKLLALAFGIVFLALPSTALGQSPRTWVSASGNDSGGCSRTAPCLTWQGALAQTAPGGEIDALDSGPFGDVTINKSVTIDGAGVHAATVTSTDAFLIDNPNAKVVLRRLVVNGARELGYGTQNSGVNILAARVVRLEGMRISEYGKAGVRSAPTNSPTRLTVVDSTIADNGGNGISVSAGSGGTSGSTNRVTLRNVSLIGNGASGIGTDASGANSVSVNVFGSLIADNAIDGIRSNGARSKVRISNTDVTGNLGQGLRALNGGGILSWGNNRIADNGVDGAPTGMINAK